MADLPKDAVYEILTRAPLEAIDASKVVSREWNNLVHSTEFMAKYSKTTNTTFGFYIQRYPSQIKYLSLDDQKEDVLSPDGKLEILASSKQGICCLGKGDKYRQSQYYVGKPCTNQWAALPNPDLRHTTLRVALVVLHSDPLEYKIIRVSGSSSLLKTSYDLEIFDSKTWRWRSSEDMALPNGVVLNRFSDNTVSVHAGGLIYWEADDNIVAFDPIAETYSHFPRPQLRDFDFGKPSPIEYGGKLGLVYSVPEQRNIELWVMDDPRTRGWSLVKQGQQLPVYDTSYANNIPMVIRGFYNRDIALLESHYQMVLYNLQTSCIEGAINLRDFVKYPCFGARFDIFPFRSDSKPVNLGGAVQE